MDGDEPMTDVPCPDEPGLLDVGERPRRESPSPQEFQARVVQDFAGLQNGLNDLIQQVQAVPSQVVAELARSNAPGESHGWRTTFRVCGTLSCLLVLPLNVEDLVDRDSGLTSFSVSQMHNKNQSHSQTPTLLPWRSYKERTKR